MKIAFPSFEVHFQLQEECSLLLYSKKCEMFVAESLVFTLGGCISEWEYEVVFRQMEKFGSQDDFILMFEGSISLDEIFKSTRRTFCLEMKRIAFGGGNLNARRSGGVFGEKYLNFKVFVQEPTVSIDNIRLLNENASIGIHLKQLKLARNSIPKGPIYVELFLWQNADSKAIYLAKSHFSIAQNRHSYNFDAFFKVCCDFFGSSLLFEFRTFQEKKLVGCIVVPVKQLIPFHQECLQIDLHSNADEVFQREFEKIPWNGSCDESSSFCSEVNFSSLATSSDADFCIVSFDSRWNLCQGKEKETFEAFSMYPSDEMFHCIEKGIVCQFDFWTPQLIQWLKETKCSSIAVLFKFLPLEFEFFAFLSILHSKNQRLLQEFSWNSLALSLLASDFFTNQTVKYASAIELMFTKHAKWISLEFLNFIFCNLSTEAKRRLEGKLVEEFEIFDFLVSQGISFSEWSLGRRIANFFPNTPLGRQFKNLFGAFSLSQRIALQREDSNYRLMAYTLLHTKRKSSASSKDLDCIWNAFQLFVKAESFCEAQRLGEYLIRQQANSQGNQISPERKANLYLELARISHQLLLDSTKEKGKFSFYKIEFQGSGFPLGLQGVSVILERSNSTLLVDIVAELGASFPDATIQSVNQTSSINLYQSIKVSSAFPLSDKIFQTKRTSDTNSFVLFDQFLVEEAFPNSFGISKIVESSKMPDEKLKGNSLQSLSSLECAIAVVREKNRQIINLFQQARWDELKMVLFGCNFATVNGGISEYKRQFLSDSYWNEHPKERTSIQKLATLCKEHEMLVEKGECAISKSI